MFTLFALLFFLIGHHAVRHRPDGRVRRPHPAGGAAAAALPHQRGARGQDAPTDAARMRAVVFAYRSRRPLPARAARARRRGGAGRHAPGCCGRDDLVPPRGRHGARRIGLRSSTPRRSATAATAADGRARRAGHDLLVLLPRTCSGRGARRCAARRLQHARLAVAAVPRPRAHQLGGAARRDARPARRCTRWWREPDAGAHRRPAGGADPARRHGARGFRQGDRRRRAACLARRARDARRDAVGLPQRHRAGQLLRRPQARGRPHRLVAAGAARSTS